MSDTESAVAEIPSDEPDALDAPLPDEIVEETKEEKDKTPPEEAQDGDEESPEETEEETPAADDADGEDAAEEVKPKKRRNVQKRISELTRAKHEAERREQEAVRQLEALQATTAPEAAPKQEDFQSIDEFVLASARYEAKQEVRRELETLSNTVQQNQQQAEQTARSADWEVKVEAARDKYDDFDDLVLSDINPVSPAMAQAYAATDNGADVAYHIASNVKLAREISALNPTQAVIRIGQLSAKLAEKPNPRTTSTPNPVKTVKAKATPQKSPDNMPYAEYVRMRTKESSNG